MSDLANAQTWVEDNLDRLTAAYDVPGAAVAVLADGKTFDTAAGIVNARTGVPTTPDTLFQIGSITKLWTASLVMQLADEGLLDLDVPVRRYLPAFTLADQAAAAVITTRQLLNHTAGFEGDIFTDTGEGDDNLERFVAGLSDVGQLFEPGEQFSYNNAGYCVLGRLVEVLREKPFDQCLREHLADPLGLTHLATGPAEALLHTAALGHMRPGPDADLEPAPVWCMARSNAPAGSRLAMRAADLLAFARMHLEEGRAADGTAVLDPATVARMHQRQVELPYLGLMGDAWGLGWEIFDTPDGDVLGHDGSTIGQAAFMRMVPERGVAIVVLTNGGDAVTLYREIVGRLLEDLAGVRMPALPAPPDTHEPVDASRFVGTYSADVIDMVVEQDDDGRVWVDQIPKGMLADLGEQPVRRELVGYAPDSLIPVEPDDGMFMPHAFVGDDGDGHAMYLHVGRALRRAGT